MVHTSGVLDFLLLQVVLARRHSQAGSGQRRSEEEHHLRAL
jgi:hypothetical protein